MPVPLLSNFKNVERADPIYQDMGHVYIFNIGPKPHVSLMGGHGTFTVPACPEGQPYSAPLKIWKMVPDGRSVDMFEMVEILDNGALLAESVVGYGQGFDPNSNMTHQGVFLANAFVTIEHDGRREKFRQSAVKKFLMDNPKAKVIKTRKASPQAISWAMESGHEGSKDEIAADIVAGNYPTEEEVLEARANVEKWQLDLVKEANTYFRAGNHIEIQDLHRWAAVQTNNTALQWVKGSLLMGKCPACASSVDTEAAICAACKTVINEAKVVSLKVPGYEHLWQKKAKAETQPTV